MTFTLATNKYNALLSRILWSCALLFFCAVVVFAVVYLCTDYSTLSAWYIRLYPCFYRSTTWSDTFFVPWVKASGNRYCIVALLISLAGIYLSVREIKRKREPLTNSVTVHMVDIAASLVCMGLAVCLWYWGSPQVKPSSDEIFSALNCAGIHPFQAMSYYMLPNNHILFNLLNSLLFHSAADKVESGRLLSLLCELALVPLMYGWFRKAAGTWWVAFLATAAMAFQFPVWGFSFQARGYELLILAEWVVFAGMLKYRENGSTKWLAIMATGIAVGYFSIPSFLYLHAAIAAYAVIRQWSERKVDLRYWWWQAIAVAVTFLLYLPALCFSGRVAITNNPWVQQNNTFTGAFANTVTILKEYADFCFCNIVKDVYIFDALLFCVPLCLFLFRKNRVAVMLGTFYSVMWAVCLVLAVVMRQLPIDRALSGQFSITFALVIYALYLSLDWLRSRIGMRWLPQVVLPVILVLFSINFVQKGKQQIVHYLVHFQVNGWYDFIGKGIRANLPGNAAIAVSEESFYWYYLLDKYHYQVHKCRDGNEHYYIHMRLEQVPADVSINYERSGVSVGDFDIYKRK